MQSSRTSFYELNLQTRLYAIPKPIAPRFRIMSLLVALEQNRSISVLTMIFSAKVLDQSINFATRGITVLISTSLIFAIYVEAWPNHLDYLELTLLITDRKAISSISSHSQYFHRWFCVKCRLIFLSQEDTSWRCWYTWSLWGIGISSHLQHSHCALYFKCFASFLASKGLRQNMFGLT